MLVSVGSICKYKQLFCNVHHSLTLSNLAGEGMDLLTEDARDVPRDESRDVPGVESKRSTSS